MKGASLREGQNGGERVDCSVLMPVLNEEHHIVASVNAMRKQRFDGRLEFIIVDGGSTDRTRELLRELAEQDGRIRLFDNPGRIAASGLNVALRHARGRWIARMDAHTEYPDDYLALGVARLQRTDTRWVSGPPVARGTDSVSRAVSLALRTPLGRGGSRKWANAPEASQAEYELDTGVFAGVWGRDTLLAYGGWDERWVCNQDSEMAARFLARGERLICLPAMAAYYTPRNSIRSLWGQYLRYGEYREKTAVRHPGSMRRSHLLAPGVVLSTACAIGAPRPLRRAARAGLLVYATTLAAAGGQAARGAERAADASLVPIVLATMHFAHGAGALRGVRRHGAPLAAIATALGAHRLARALSPSRVEVWAPSLWGQDQDATTGPHLVAPTSQLPVRDLLNGETETPRRSSAR
jgi:succinoglycan biosynthesis protein ExoA